jgi:hypothetical protein
MIAALDKFVLSFLRRQRYRRLTGLNLLLDKGYCSTSPPAPCFELN